MKNVPVEVILNIRTAVYFNTMKNEGLLLGYLAVMLISAFFVDTTPTWWCITLIGSLIMTIIWIILDRKEFKRLLNKIDWDAIKYYAKDWFNS